MKLKDVGVVILKSFIVSILVVVVTLFLILVPDAKESLIAEVQHSLFILIGVSSSFCFAIAFLVFFIDKRNDIKRLALEKKIEEQEEAARRYWKKHTFYGKIVNDKTGKVVREWKRKDHYFHQYE